MQSWESVQGIFAQQQAVTILNSLPLTGSRQTSIPSFSSPSSHRFLSQVNPDEMDHLSLA
jgi:hypothetical protein